MSKQGGLSSLLGAAEVHCTLSRESYIAKPFQLLLKSSIVSAKYMVYSLRPGDTKWAYHVSAGLVPFASRLSVR
jgi:hypothetical protein